MTFDLVDVFEEWMCSDDRSRLSRRKLAFLESAHTEALELVGIGKPMIASSFFSDELDLPFGCYWNHLTADLLDFIRPRKGISRLTELLQLQLQHGEIEQDFYDCFER